MGLEQLYFINGKIMKKNKNITRRSQGYCNQCYGCIKPCGKREK